jgi:hypothetical protein
MSKAHEFVIFNFKAGIELATQKELMAKIDDCATKLDGFLKRNYYYSEDSKKWIDHVIWETHQHAKNASEAIMQDPTALEIFQQIDDSNMMMSHFNQEN